MKVYEHVTDFPYPRHLVRQLTMGPGGLVRFVPEGGVSVVRGNPDDLRVGNEFTVRVQLPYRPFPRPLSTYRYVAIGDDVQVTDDIDSGIFTSWRHEAHLSDLPGGGTRIFDRIMFEAPKRVEDTSDASHDRDFRYRARRMLGDLAIHQLLSDRRRKILISGASGLIGTQLVALLVNAGHTVGRLVRSPEHGYALGTPIPWDPARRHLPPGILDGVDAVINLSGHSIGGRFTRGNKEKILQSRLDATHTLADAVARHPSTALIQASGIGVYGARRPGEVLTEESATGDGFLADVVRQWEDAARAASDAGARVAFMRTGIVLSQAGGALLPQLPLFFLGLGGRLAPAHGMNSWIGLADVTRAYAYAVATESVQGPVNMVGPSPVSNGEFAQALGRVINRPAWLPVPSVGPKLILGSEGYDQLINTDQDVSAGKLQAAGFRFGEPTVADALNHTLWR
ncbi:TIGR01777 family oxidoreductase [Tessaracoccus lubricantis]|uniref:TIGR01777 family oxidoreductase n=1 Tax=Tessaracoccus lubricantis TaxID=545543 RepID=A0ABP9F8H2_9ACTN